MAYWVKVLQLELEGLLQNPLGTQPGLGTKPR